MKKSRLVIILLCVVMQFSLTGCAEMILSALTDGEEYVISGVENYENGNYYAAIEDLKKAEELGLRESKIGDVYGVIGHCYLELDELDTAFVYYEKSLETDPDSVVYLTNIAIAYRHDGDYEKAMECYLEAYEIDPDYSELNSSIGALYVLQGEPEKAISYLERAIELDPTIGTSYGNMAMAYAFLGDFVTARDYLKTSILYGYDNADVVKELIEEMEGLE